ncbi:VOC family protein [Mesorhizobium amorphae]|uniref:Glyoxalase/bleomycin resistance protein/dioxygenase n=1 Tax=Mesorhizobium amorphae CCNWGS0123 TaxID=1082933 RepID=G6YEQ6_9HYPH|nr:VOC family protein [Mesorhizobium amorphae]ANT52608.1 glyoxalase [Mesorhizobium amorphae CCNWGS0123]EHH09716.1 glyoxalase/bleomycin resistance protein/dioxygenase [Mesorhizobium amorphae CCNWGS0123]GLR43647.1 glyoxalase [Mesorhizobium amorphae]
MPKSPLPFFWYELMTTDLDAAEAFYTAVVGWTAQPFDMAPGMPPYIVMNVGERGVSGLMTLPEDAAKMGMPPAWLGYIHTKDVDAATKSLKDAGGAVHRAPDDIPRVGRFAVVADPQGATFMLLQPNGPDQPPVPASTPGHIGWHELYASDWKAAFDFYSGQFGWTKGDSMDMGPMGTYQTFGAGPESGGGMMNKPQQIPVPVWQFYFNVPAIDAAAKRVTDNGGKILMGPMEVPGGSWIVQCQDPQGAHFALMAPVR